MDLLTRLDVLKSTNILSERNYQSVVRVIKYFKNSRNMELTEENASAFITHLCMALERIDKGEAVEPLDRSVYEAACQEPTFEEATLYCHDIREILPQISETEAEYVIAHIGAMLGNL